MVYANYSLIGLFPLEIQRWSDKEVSWLFSFYFDFLEFLNDSLKTN